MKYVAIDELNNFSFHDAKIQKIDLHDGNMTWQLSLVNATIENSQNEFDKDMCIEQAEIIFEHVCIVDIVFGAYKVFSNHVLIESVEARSANPNEYNDILQKTLDDYCYIYSMKELPNADNETHLVCFHIDGGVGNYFLTLSFSKSIVQWNEYCGMAWYEDEKWKKK
jgi:hypothetical protein